MTGVVAGGARLRPTGRSRWHGRGVVPSLWLLGVVVLAGCADPPPQSSLHARGQTLSAPAAAYCFDGGSVDRTPLPESCATERGAPPMLDVRFGDRVGVEVDPAVAERGWRVALLSSAGQVASLPRVTGRSSTTFRVPRLATGTTVLVEVVAEAGDPAAARGVWRFRLRVG